MSTLRDLKDEHRYDGLHMEKNEFLAYYEEMFSKGLAIGESVVGKDAGSDEVGEAYNDIVNHVILMVNAFMNHLCGRGFGLTGFQAGAVPLGVLFLSRYSDRGFKVVDVDETPEGSTDNAPPATPEPLSMEQRLDDLIERVEAYQKTNEREIESIRSFIPASKCIVCGFPRILGAQHYRCTNCGSPLS